MKTKHTPGPWSINQWTQPDGRISIGAVGTPLVAIIPSRDVSYNQQKANAALVEAAPELLKNLEQMVKYAEHIIELSQSIDGVVDSRINVEHDIEQSYDAIAKAKGEA